ncbi:MAG: hypothetical protein ACRC7S_14800 [Cetobacterium sp.]
MPLNIEQLLISIKEDVAAIKEGLKDKEARIVKLEKNQEWLVRLVIGALVGAALSLLFTTIK